MPYMLQYGRKYPLTKSYLFQNIKSVKVRKPWTLPRKMMSFNQCGDIEVLLKPPPSAGILPGCKIPAKEYLGHLICWWHTHISVWDTEMWQYVAQIYRHTLKVIMVNLRERIKPQGVPESGIDGQVQNKCLL